MMTLAIIQGIYFSGTGIWPLLHYRSFEKVTGPKTDVWLVKTVGVIILVIGITLIIGYFQMTPAIFVLGAGSAVGLMLIELVYSLRNVISKVYLLDAILEFLLLLGWLINVPKYF